MDDGPKKNLLKDVYSAVHPPTWFNDDEDRFITMQLQPWLEDLFRSSVAVTDLVKLVPLPGGQLLIYRKFELAIKILRGVML